jgi:hypothetical protein
MKLDLRAPLVYSRFQWKAETADFPREITENEEFLFCFELDPKQGRSFEPEREQLLGPLLFSGCLTNGQAETVSLPQGEYLFVQRRSALNTEEWLDLAIEQQKDGLWERYKFENRLYVRYLYEDDRPVTQILRKIRNEELAIRNERL